MIASELIHGMISQIKIQITQIGSQLVICVINAITEHHDVV